MDEFETAIMLSLDPTVTGEIKENANRYCESVRTTPNAWQFCLDKIFKTNILQVKFFCFQILQDLILHRYATLSDAERAQLKGAMLQWLREGTSTKQDDHAIKNKYAQIMALLMRAEYPDQWPTFFRDLMGILNGAGPHVVDVFLRIIKSVDDEVISHELHRNPTEIAQTARIKDAMREGAVVDLVRVWYELLTHYKSSPPYLINTCLQTVKGYVGWIDIGLVVNEKFMGIIFELLGNRNYCEQVVDCLYEIVCKGMEPHAKFNLLKQLNIKSILAAAGSDDMDFIAKIGRLANMMGTELLASITPVLSAANGVANGVSTQAAEVESMLNDMLALLFKLLDSESDEVSASVLSFAADYVNRVHKSGKVTDAQLKHLELLLTIIRHKAKYPTTFDFEVEDEDEKVFLELRKELTTIYRNILRIIPNRALEFVRLTLTAVSVTPPAPFPDSEIALYLFYLMGEMLPATQDAEAVKTTEQFFTQMMISLSSNPLASHPHQSVTTMYFDTVVRYAKYLPHAQPQYLVAVMTAFLDARGLRHPMLAVRTRVAVSFRHFVRNSRATLFPYLDSIVSSLKELLVISFDVQKSVPFDDQVNFYESLGVLIGSNPDVNVQQKHTNTLIQPALAQMEEILAKELYKNDIATGKPYYTVMLAQLITVVGTFSKGFVAFPKDARSASPSRPHPNGKPQPESPPPSPAPSPSTPLSPSRLIFVNALELVLRVPTVLPAHEELREKTFFFLHRMIEVLGPSLFPILPSALALLLSNAHRTKDILEFITLVNQIISRFKETVFALINEMLMPFLQRMFEFLNPSTPPTAQSEEQREWFELQKSYYVFLQCILNNNLANVFTSPANAPHFNQILSTVVQGCGPSSKLVPRDITIQKVCVSILRRMVDEWAGNPTFNTLLFEQVVPRLFETVWSPNFDISDAATNALAAEIAKLHRSVYIKTGAAFITFLAQVYLPSVKCPPEATQQYLQELQKEDKGNPKQFIDFFKNFIRMKKT